LDISHARINTEKGAALDNIYIQTSKGEKLTDKDTMATLREGLEKAVFVV
jgi:[protein-PII] uridylyltransferase